MERNVNYPAGELHEIVIHLAWAQLEIYADDVDQIQVIASGDAHTLSDLRIAVKDGLLEIEQPQYGISLDITHGHWMQLCIRVPKTWDHTVRAHTISGALAARGLGCENIELETITGDLKAAKLTGGQLALRTTAGAIRGEVILAQRLTVRSVSGNIVLDDASAQSYRFTSVSGDIHLKLKETFEQLEVRSVSGDCSILTELDQLQVCMRSVSGHKTMDGVKLTEDTTMPAIRVTGVSGDLKIIGTRKA